MSIELGTGQGEGGRNAAQWAGWPGEGVGVRIWLLEPG